MSTKEVDMPYNFVKHSQSLNPIASHVQDDLNHEQTLKAKLSTHKFKACQSTCPTHCLEHQWCG